MSASGDDFGPLWIDELPEHYVDFWEGEEGTIKYLFSPSLMLWCKVFPRTPNLYHVVNGLWTGYCEGKFFITPGGNHIECVEDLLYGFYWPRISEVSDWEEVDPKDRTKWYYSM